jgi:hypothetical protein
MFDFITGHILAVLGKFDTEPVVRALVEAGNEPLDDEPCTQLHVCKLGDHVRLEILKIILSH